MAISSTSFTRTPQAGDDGWSGLEDQLSGGNILVLDVLANDQGGNAKALYSVDNGDALADLLARDPGLTSEWETTAGGNLVRINAGKIEFKLAPGNDLDSLALGQQYTDSFRYAIQLGNGTLSWATVTLNVTGENDGPEAVADTAVTGENQEVVIDVLANDTDADQGHVFTLLSVQAPAGQGSVRIDEGKVVFDPGTDFDHLAQGTSTTVELTYWMKDEHGAQSSATLLVTVDGANDAPVAVADTGSGGENDVVTVDALANDTDLDDGAVLSLVSASTAPGEGSASIASGQVAFDPGTDFDYLNIGGTATVEVAYTAQDDQGAEASSIVMVTLQGTNDPASITGVASASASETNAPLTLSGSLAAVDVDDDDGFKADSVQGTHGSFVIGADGEWSFLADTALDALNVGDSASESFTVESIDGTQAAVAITIHGTNDTAQITGLPTDATVQEDGTLTVSGDLGVIDPDDSLTFQSVAPADLQTTYGTFMFDAATGQWSYTLANSSSGVQDLNTGDTRTDSLVVRSSDGTAVATLEVSIQGLNDLLAYAVPALPMTTSTIDGTNQANTITGTAANETINGLQGQDTLNGAGGDDILNGGQATDTLTGGTGSDYLNGDQGTDSYRFTSLADATDVIVGFVPGERIVFGGAITGGGASLSLIQVDTDGNSVADATLLRVDSNGAATGGTIADMALVLDTPLLSMSDIDWILS